MIVHAKRPAKRRQKPLKAVQIVPAIMCGPEAGEASESVQASEEAGQEAAEWLWRQLA